MTGHPSFREMNLRVFQGKVLLDDIPGVLFLPMFSRDELMNTVERIVELFSPGLVLGVSDEVPHGADAEEAAERIRMVSDWCRTHPNTQGATD